MEWKLFDEWIDVPLYGQMKDLIYQSCQKEDRYTLLQQINQSDLFTDTPKLGIDAEYHLFYPGEVLERLGERMAVTDRQVRALGLAFARTKILQEDRMFVGDQAANFLGSMRRQLGRDELFMLGFHVLMDGTEREKAYKKLLQYPFEELREILFALSILPEDDGLWQAVCGKLNALLGKARDISVFENAEVYVWLAKQACFQYRMKSYRKKDLDALKYVMRLPFLNIFGKQDTVKKKLTENGYAPEELSYLNSLMIREVRFQDSIFSGSITGEKIAVETCRRLLGSDKVFPAQAYTLCSLLLQDYRSFQVKIQGQAGILEALEGRVTIQTVEAFRVLYPYSSSKERFRQWKTFDLADPKWDWLYTWLSETEYEECVTESLRSERYAGTFEKGLKHYQELTGKDYTERFWRESIYKNSLVFQHLADHDALPVVELMETFLAGYQKKEEGFIKKWKYMAWYLQEYVKKIRSYKAFQMLKLYAECIGPEDIPEMFSFGEVVRSCLIIRSRDGRIDEQRLDISRTFLKSQEQRQLFSWIEEYQFQHNTQMYLDFLKDALLNQDTSQWFTWEEAREIYFALKESGIASVADHSLRKMYLTEPERDEIEKREEEENRRKKEKKRWERITEIKKEFTRLVAKKRYKPGQYRQFSSFLDQHFFSHRKETAEMISRYFKDAKTEIYVFSDGDLDELMKLLLELHRHGGMDLEALKQCIGKAEVRECKEDSEKVSAHV